MSDPQSPADRATAHAGAATSAVDRVHISCPGCGRHDWVSWPNGSATFEWKCFNCGKQFSLDRKGGH